MKWDIGIDVRMIQHTGIGTYTRQILPEILVLAKKNSRSTALYESPTKPCTQSASAHRPFDAPIYSFQEQWKYPSLLKECRLWHAPHYNIPFWKGKTKLIVTIHDIIHWIFRKDFLSKPQEIYAETMLKRAVNLSDHIISVSEHTKLDLIKHFKADPQKITVTYEAVDPDFSQVISETKKQKICEKYHLPSSFFLYVGSFKPHKNLNWLIESFSRLHYQQKIKSALVVAGKHDPKNQKLSELLNAGKSKGFLHHIPHLPYEDLPALYQRSQGLIHPSLYEGFGLTLLEAMASGIPVIACKNSSIPEVAGEGACLIDSSNFVQLENAILQLEEQPNVRQNLIKKGRKNIERFSWKKTSEQTYEVYEKVLNRL